jgi:hypothetical protein
MRLDRNLIAPSHRKEHKVRRVVFPEADHFVCGTVNIERVPTHERNERELLRADVSGKSIGGMKMSTVPGLLNRGAISSVQNSSRLSDLSSWARLKFR